MNLSFSCCFVALLFTAPQVVQAQRQSPVRASSKAEANVRVTRFNPQGVAQPRDPIYVQFSADMISSDTLKTTTTAEAVLAFDPAVEGYLEWESTRRLRFYPRFELKKGTRYVAKLAPALESLAGKKLTGPTEFRFSTPRLALEEAEQVGFTADRRALIQLRFTDEVVPQDLQKFLTISTGADDIAWTVAKNEKTHTPEIQTDPLTSEGLLLHLAPGLKGVGGPLGIDKPVNRPVFLTFRLAPEKLSARWRQDRASLVIKFSSPVRSADLKKHVNLTPNIPFEVLAKGNEVRLLGDFQAETRYTVQVSEGLRGSGGQLLLRNVTLSAWVPPIKAFIEMKEAGGHLSSEGRMRLRVRSSGVKSFTVKATRLYDNNLVHFLNDSNSEYGLRSQGTEIASRDIAVSGDPKSVTLTEVQLRDIISSAPLGLYLVQVTAKRPEQGDNVAEDEDDGDSGDGYYYYDDYNESLLQDRAMITVSNLGLVGKKSDEHLSVWVGRLNDAQPVVGAKVRAYSNKNQLVQEGTTDEQGMVNLPKSTAPAGEETVLVVAQSGDDICQLLLSEMVSFDEEHISGDDEDGPLGRAFLRRGYEAFFSPERGVYRPGELVHLFGFLRGADGAVPPPFPMELEIRRPDGKAWEPRPLTANSSGTLETELVVPDYGQTGLYTAVVQLAGTTERRARLENTGYGDESNSGNGEREEIGQAQFYVEEFLPNRLKVEATAPEVRFAPDEPLTVSVLASEMFGQPAAGRTVSVAARFRVDDFKPKEFPGYTFGDRDTKYDSVRMEAEDTQVGQDGRTSVTVPLPQRLPNSAVNALVHVTVKDIGGRAVSTVLQRKLDPVPYYIGAKLQAETFAKAGTPATFELVGVKPDGTLVDSDELTATVSRVRYNSILKRSGTSFRYETRRQLDVQTETSATLVSGKGSLAWTPSEAGSYLLRLASIDDKTVTALPFEVSSLEWGEQPWSLEKPERLELVLDKLRYAPGEKAKVVVKAPFAGTLLLTLEQDRVLSTTVVQMTANTHEVEIPIEAAHMPNFYCVASVIRPVKPEEKWLPHRAIGRINVVLSHDPQRLAVSVTAPEERRPESDLNIGLRVVDIASSAPVSAEMLVWAVDEGILTLTDFQTPDPIAFFYAARRLMVGTADFYSDLMPEILERIVAKSDPGGDAGSMRKRMSPVRNERTKPLSLWAGIVRTDAQGSATVNLRLPQFMGRVRVMAVAAGSSRFGSGDGTVFVRSPLMIKENMPRFLAPGDEISVPFVVYNNTDVPQGASVAIETSGPIELQDSTATGGKLTLQTEVIPARGMVTLPVAMKAGDAPAPAAVKYSGTMAGESYRDAVNLPVRPPSASVRVAAFDSIEAGKSKELALPSMNFFPGTTSGSLVISTLPAVHLTGAFKYLTYYRYGCMEQTVSSAFPLLFLPELAETLESRGYSKYGMQMKVQHAVDRIFSMQLRSGLLSMWPESRGPWTWGSTYAAHFLVEAKKAGYEVPDAYLDELLSALRDQMTGEPRSPRHEGLAERAYANYILALAGRKSLERMESLYELRNELSPSARSLLACAYQVAGNNAEASDLMSDGRNFVTTETLRQTSGYLASPVRETAIVLAALLDTNSSAAEIPQLVARLERQRNSQGHWGTTQDNAFAIWALGKYARRIQQAPSNFTGTVTLASGDTRDFSSSESLGIAAGEVGKSATVKVDGTGTAYLAYVVEGVPINAQPAISKQLKVSRILKDRKGRRLDPRTLKQGQFVIVEVVVEGTRNIKNLVIEDLLPAGLEVENPNLSSSETISESGEQDAEEVPEEYGDEGSSVGDGAEGEEADESADEGEAADEPSTATAALSVQRTEVRDDRMVAFVDFHADPSKPSRSCHFQYGARAVTAGTFIQPGVQVSCMYEPEVEARSAPGTISVITNP